MEKGENKREDCSTLTQDILRVELINTNLEQKLTLKKHLLLTHLFPPHESR